MKEEVTHKEVYHKYLKSKQWREKKEVLFKVRGRKCERYKKGKCSKKIEVHHKTYENIFNEKLEDLEVLCSNCHKKEHNIINEKIIKNSKNKKYFSKKVKKQTAKRKHKKTIQDLRNDKLEKKGKTVRRLKKLGIKEYEGKNIIYYSLNELENIYINLIENNV